MLNAVATAQVTPRTDPMRNRVLQTKIMVMEAIHIGDAGYLVQALITCDNITRKSCELTALFWHGSALFDPTACSIMAQSDWHSRNEKYNQ